MSKAGPAQSKQLIVNADDFGYFPCVSRGIIEAARAGVITATSVLANRPGVESSVRELLGVPGIDVGVHLNLTSGEPLATALRGRLQGADSTRKLLLAANMPGSGGLLRDVGDEWRAQIRTCVDWGVSPTFLNSHEHVHMLPRLFGIVRELAQEYTIPFVRYTRPEWRYARSGAGLFRNAVMQVLYGLHGRELRRRPMPRMWGLSVSGRVDLGYLQRLVSRLKPGETGELMCHPGRFDPAEIGDPRLLAYHDWDGEYAALMGQAFRKLLARENVRLVRFSALA